QLIRPNRPSLILDPSPGFITINEISIGYGLSGTETPYSKSFFGITSVNGYQANEYFMLGAGTGLLMFNDGLMIPLFVDMRLRIDIDDITPYLSGAGGLLLNPSDFDAGTRMFINPSAGARLTLSRSFALSLSGGLWMQMGSNIGRASFINIKSGAVYKF
ncbi:MAG: hypothetical protein ABR531_10660, partial [Bacteroidales bacterium]